MKADYYRYLAEFKTGSVQVDVATQAEKAYELASNVAVHKLAPTHPIRLGLALNYSVFLFEVQARPWSPWLEGGMVDPSPCRGPPPCRRPSLPLCECTAWRTGQVF